MANTVVARFAVVLFIIAASFETVLSIKCFKCTGTSLEECERNETIQTCNDSMQVGAACGQFYLQSDIFSSYTKLCAVAKADFCKAINFTIPFNCTAPQVCFEDYCNGVAPTTLAPTVIESTTALPGKEMTTNKQTCSDASAIICNKTFQLLVACVVAVLSRL